MHHACVPILLTFAGSPQQAGPLLKILRDVKPSNLYIAVGKSRPSSQGDTELFKGLRREIEVDWTCQVHWYAQYDGAEHGGLIDAATWFFSQVEEGIVVEVCISRILGRPNQHLQDRAMARIVGIQKLV